MPNPNCLRNVRSLQECEGFRIPERIPLSENLCHGIDDIGVRCWGEPTFVGWQKHWKGKLQLCPIMFLLLT